MYVREKFRARDRIIIIRVDGPEPIINNIDDVMGGGTTEEKLGHQELLAREAVAGEVDVAACVEIKRCVDGA